MKINVKRIPVDGERLTGSEPGAIIELDEPDVGFREPVEYEVLAQLQGKALLVTGWLRTNARMRCSRCVKLFAQPVTVSQFVAHRELAGEDFVDLTPQIREDILLELPQRALCRPDCKGLCSVCGKDLNEGACGCKVVREQLQWHALDQLKLK